MMTAIMLVRSVVVVMVRSVVVLAVVRVGVRVVMMLPGRKRIYQARPAFGTCGHLGLG